jgi:hypothetical protein
MLKIIDVCGRRQGFEGISDDVVKITVTLIY